MKRNFVEEILAATRTKQRHSAYFKIIFLENIYAEPENLPADTIKYIPVTIIAHLEVYVRSAIKELVDYGSPYTDRAEQLKDTLKFDFNTIKAISQKIITLGDFIAHLLPFSSLEHINTNLSILLNIHFFKELMLQKENVSSLIGLELYEEEKLILDAGEETFSIIRTLFQLRHVIVHEVGPENLIAPLDVNSSIGC